MCEECGQRPATVHVTRRVNGHQTEMHLCAQCAMEKGEIGPLMQSPAWMLEQFLSALGGFGLGSPSTAPAAAPARPGAAGRCPACGLPFQEFARTGMLGCANCYEAFRRELGPAIRRIHGAARHVGHRPPDGSAPRPVAGTRGLAGAAPSPGAPESTAERVARLRAELQKAVAEERYEDAARLRDEIRALTKE